MDGPCLKTWKVMSKPPTADSGPCTEFLHSAQTKDIFQAARLPLLLQKSTEPELRFLQMEAQMLSNQSLKGTLKYMNLCHWDAEEALSTKGNG